MMKHPDRESTVDESGEPSPGIAARMTSISTALRSATDLLREAEVRTIEDLELRRLHTIMAERLRGLRLAFSELEKYLKRVYGEGRVRSVEDIQADVGRLADTIHGVRLECRRLVVELGRDHRPPEPERAEMVENRRAPNVSYYLHGFLGCVDDDELPEVEEKLREASICTAESLARLLVRARND